MMINLFVDAWSNIMSKNKRPRTQSTQSQINHYFSSRAPPEVIDLEADVVSESSQVRPTKLNKSHPAPFKLPDKNATSTLAFSPVNVDPAIYEPHSQPATSDKAPYALLTLAFVALSQTKSRIAILNILTNVLRTIVLKYPSSLLPSVYLLSNSFAPQFVALELGLGPSVVSRSIQQVSGLSSAALRKLYNTTGDPGDVAFTAKSNLRTLIPHPPLTVPYVYNSLLKIAACKGQGAAKEKQKIVERLLLAASGEEVRYLTRTLLQNLRVGAVRTSILTALARAVVLTPPEGVKDQTIQCNGETYNIDRQSISRMLPSNPKGKKRNTEQDQIIALLQKAESLVKQVYAKHPNFDQIIPALLENGLNSLSECVPLTVGLLLVPC
jgi:DNA ligase-1